MKPKLRQIEIAKLTDLMGSLVFAKESVDKALEFAKGIETDANDQVAAMREKLQKHLDRKDLRPHFLAKPHGKGIWTFSFNSETYSLGPNPVLKFDDVDEDVMNFWWSAPSSDIKHPCKTLFMGFIAIVQHYCNQGHEDVNEGLPRSKDTTITGNAVTTSTLSPTAG